MANKKINTAIYLQYDEGLDNSDKILPRQLKIGFLLLVSVVLAGIGIGLGIWCKHLIDWSLNNHPQATYAFGLTAWFMILSGILARWLTSQPKTQSDTV